MPLLDLPPELVTLVAEHIGATNLRKSVTYLLVAKGWYWAVLPVYLSGLQLSRLYLSSHDLERFPPPTGRLGQLMLEKTTRVSLRLVGHPSRGAAARGESGVKTSPWHDNSAASDDGNETCASYEEEERETRLQPHRNEGLEASSVRDELARNPLTLSSDNQRILESRVLHWRQYVNDMLSQFAGILPVFENLKEVSVKACNEVGCCVCSRWNYLFGSSMRKIICSLRRLTQKVLSHASLNPNPKLG